MRCTSMIGIGMTLVLTGIFVLSARTQSAQSSVTQMQVPENADYSKFRHDSSYHARLPCLLCHRRENNSARPAMPGKTNHLPCAGCHVKQFAGSNSPICTVCHANAQSGALKPFPRLTSFSMRFDHSRHIRMNSVSCATCHKPTRGGMALSVPAGFNAHVTCYRCHGPNAKSGERDISSCDTCHQAGRPLHPSETAAAFAVGFSHSRHDGSEGLGCTQCHFVRATASLRMQVSSPQPLNHHASAKALSCMSCHNGKRAFGGDDFSVCKRCHKGNTWHF